MTDFFERLEQRHREIRIARGLPGEPTRIERLREAWSRIDWTLVQLRILLVIQYAAAFLIIAAVLTGCTTPIVRPDTPLADRIPSSLLTCADRPVAGSLERQSDVARYVVELDAAGEDCRRKVNAVGQIVEAEGEAR